ncbi:MAG: hypothetical protein EAZ61_03795 [Oscillatoriales cyanobacterium]|nr:MAG: hypothetical protein EAZ61_03795 [Oscillatoriales cyanobacterium]
MPTRFFFLPSAQALRCLHLGAIALSVTLSFPSLAAIGATQPHRTDIPKQGRRILKSSISTLRPTKGQAKPAMSAIAQASDEDINVRVYELASPAVVAIDVGNGSGSGSIITPDGLVLTNSHVVERATGPVTVTLNDGRELTADVVGFDPSGRDLAAVQIRNVSNLPTIQRGARPVRVGQRAFAIGSPFGFSNTFTIGIVSRIDPDDGTIQTDAAINPGNSGGRAGRCSTQTPNSWGSTPPFTPRAKMRGILALALQFPSTTLKPSLRPWRRVTLPLLPSVRVCLH